jgi:hypothetical protein
VSASVSFPNSPRMAVAADATVPPGRMGDRLYSTLELRELVHDGDAWRVPWSNATGVALGPPGHDNDANYNDATLAGTDEQAARYDHEHNGRSVLVEDRWVDDAGSIRLDEALAYLKAQTDSTEETLNTMFVGVVPDPAATAGTLETGASQPEQFGTVDQFARVDHQHPIATPQNDGFMSKAQAAQLAGGVGGGVGGGTSGVKIVNWTSGDLTLDASHADALIVWNGPADATLWVPDDTALDVDGFTASLVHRGSANYKVSVQEMGAAVVTQVNVVEYVNEVPRNRMVTLIKTGPNDWITTGGYKTWQAA